MADKYSNEELKWRAKSDARTLTEAEEIRSDPSRLKMAVKCLKEIKEQAEDAMERSATEAKIAQKLSETFKNRRS